MPARALQSRCPADSQEDSRHGPRYYRLNPTAPQGPQPALRVMGQGGFHAGLSAKHKRRLCVVVDVFTPHALTGQAPSEGRGSEARRMPLDRFINDPFRALQERGHVKEKPQMADLLRVQAAAA
jgi:hypothetical protein